MAERLGRHAILFHARCRRALPALTEAIVHDHFETFIGHQDLALGIGTAVGADSWFVYDLDPAPHRGSGRRPDRAPLSKSRLPPRSSYVTSIRRAFLGLIPHVSDDRRLLLRVDGRNDYQVAVHHEAIGPNVDLQVYPNPKRGPRGTPRSPEAKAWDVAMFPVNQLHQMVRHSSADHKRETISFGRRLESIVARAHLLAVWKNFIKCRSERKPDRTTPAMRIGLTDSSWRWERVLSRRLFPARANLTQSALRIYAKRWTKGLPELDRRHAA